MPEQHVEAAGGHQIRRVQAPLLVNDPVAAEREVVTQVPVEAGSVRSECPQADKASQQGHLPVAQCRSISNLLLQVEASNDHEWHRCEHIGQICRRYQRSERLQQIIATVFEQEVLLELFWLDEVL